MNLTVRLVEFRSGSGGRGRGIDQRSHPILQLLNRLIAKLQFLAQRIDLRNH